jgi:hypothetical protein
MYSIDTLYHLTIININTIGILSTTNISCLFPSFPIYLCFNALMLIQIKNIKFSDLFSDSLNLKIQISTLHF